MGAVIMNGDQIEFKWLDVKLIGNDTVTFKLEDGATLKVRVDVDRAGVALNFKNPDGSAHYNLNISPRITLIPPGKKYSLPRSQIKVPPQPKPKPDEKAPYG